MSKHTEYTVTFNNEDGLGIFFKQFNRRVDCMNKRIRQLENENKILNVKISKLDFRIGQMEMKQLKDNIWKIIK